MEEIKEKCVVSQVVDFIQKEGTNLDTETLQEVATAIYRVSKKSGIDYRIILALAKVESNFRIDAVSPKGARGLLQVKPSVAHKVAKDLGIKLHNRKSLHDSQKNVMIGTHILSNLIEEYHDIHYALSAYNMGETRLSDYSSQNYRTKFSNAVLKEYKRYIEVLPDP
ncbi:MAG: transglycosylase SLT domain-containing protein [Deltaproteobacteria bacterium]|nr:transglycosylase SLT domain-containing protein [Deltaproteobacteria bacterium]